MKKFLFGALLGAGVALLCAPASGRRTRSMLRDKATGLGNDISDMVDKKGRHLKNKMEGYRHKANELKTKVRGRMDMVGTGSEPTPSI